MVWDVEYPRHYSKKPFPHFCLRLFGLMLTPDPAMSGVDSLLPSYRRAERPEGLVGFQD